MQKQYSESNCSDDKYSIYSKSGRKLYHRINNNIRVLNKSKLSNKSNNSIGSVALRRTQLSNDKIYSRQQELIPLNSSQVGIDFQSGFDAQSQKKSVPLTPLMSNENYRQRIRDSPSQRSLRSDSQKSSRYQQNTRKFNKNQIQKLLMLQGERNYNNQPSIKERQSTRRQERQNSKRQKQSIRSSRQKDDRQSNYGQSNIRSIRTIKSSIKSNLKVGSSRNMKDPMKYYLNSQQSNDIQKLSRKYNKDINLQSKLSKDKKQYDYKIKQKYTDQLSRNDTQRDWNQNQRRQKSRNLQKYQSEKYLSTNDSQINSRNSGKKRVYLEQKRTIDDQRKDLRREQERKDKNYYTNNNYKKQMYQNSLQKYQKDTWARNMHRKNVVGQKNMINQQLFMGQQNFSYQKGQQYIQSPQYQVNPASSTRPQRQYHKTYKHDDRSGFLQMKSKHQRSDLRNIRIKQQDYGNLYGSYDVQQNNIYEQMNKKNPRSRNKYKSPQYQSPKNLKKYQPTPQYYYHLNTGQKKNSPNLNSPQTQISQTFDSLMLSINSHVTSSSMGQSNSIQSVIDKINLHLGTLQMISDYAQQFKKMYEQVQDWQQLVFLTFKKFWVQRVKVLEYVKKFRKIRRHQSQRMPKNGSKKIIDNKLISTKNICSEIPRLSNSQDPFAQQALIQNPFIIPFCKVTQEQIKKVARSQEGNILLQKLQKQTSTVYQSLQEMYNLVISKSGDKINMLYCDNFSDDIFVMMLQQIQQMIPNLEEFKLFEATKIRLGKIVKVGILLLFLNGKVIRNIAQILTFDDCQKIGNKKKIKTFTTYDLYYEVFEKLVSE